jgi:DNA primase
MSFDEAALLMPSMPAETKENDSIDFYTDKDLAHEKNLVRLIIEHGNEKLEGGKSVAAWIWEEIDSFPLENPDMIHLMDAYKQWYREGKMPDGKTLQYHEDERVRTWVMNLFEPEHEISQRWNEKLGIQKTIEPITIKQQVETSLLYFKLRKVKKMIAQNQTDMEHAQGDDQLLLLQIHKHLKDVEREITQVIGTVIVK